MERYELYLLLHIVGAVIWLGGGLLMIIQNSRAERRLDADHIGKLLSDADALGTRVFIPASLLVLSCGILMVVDGPWDFGELWIVLALAGFAATFLTGVVVIEPTSRRIKEMVERDGGVSPDALLVARRLLAVGRADAVVLFCILTVMVIKPTGGDVAVLVGLAAAVAAAAAYAIQRLRALTPQRAPAEAGAVHTGAGG